MKQITEPQTVTAANAWGRDTTFTKQTFELEESDVGQQKPNYLGCGYKSYLITRADVGRRICVQSSPGWQCWSFS